MDKIIEFRVALYAEEDEDPKELILSLSDVLEDSDLTPAAIHMLASPFTTIIRVKDKDGDQ